MSVICRHESRQGASGSREGGRRLPPGYMTPGVGRRCGVGSQPGARGQLEFRRLILWSLVFHRGRTERAPLLT